MLCRSYITPTDSELITTGEFEPVQGTAYDFLTPTTIGSRTFETGADPPGYDINYVLWGFDGPEALAATQDCVVFDECAHMPTMSLLWLKSHVL